VETIKLKPEKDLQAIWILSWVAALILGVLFFLFLVFSGKIMVTIFLVAGWVLIMIPVLIWIPYAFRALEYYIDDEGVKMKSGVIWKKFVTVPFHKITNIDITQGPIQRFYRIGTIHVQTAGAGGQQGQKAELKMLGVRELEEVRNVIVGRLKDSTYSPSKVNLWEEMAEPAVVDKESIFKEILNELREIKSLIKNR